MTQMLAAEDADRLRECVGSGRVAVFPTDTVYGVCCDPDDEAAAQRLYELKGRSAMQPSAVMFFTLDAALNALPELDEGERSALSALLPGPVTVLLENRRARYGAACRSDRATLGLRVPWLPEAQHALCALEIAVMQSSANISGQPDARTLQAVPASVREGADVVLDGGTLPGIASTVVDLREYPSAGAWHVLREGALATEAVGELLAQAG
jgi:L-threonylcarbamoyladenylate synthase